MKRVMMACVALVCWGAAVSQGGAAEGQIAGRAIFDGEPPKAQAVNFGAEKQCALIHGDKPPIIEEISVGTGGGLRAVLVYIKDELPGPFTAPTEPVVIDQHGCLFAPRIAAVMVGQPVEFRNSDPVLHNVRASSKLRQAFNLAQPTQGMKTTRTFKLAELAMPLKCDVHFWMVGYLHVLAHPYFAITGDDGAFTLPTGLPDGTYTLEAWHEKLGTQAQALTVQGGTSPSPIVFRFAKPN